MNLAAIQAGAFDHFIVGPNDLSHPNCSTGLTVRDYTTHPVGYSASAPAFDMPLMTDDEIESCIVRKDLDNSWLDNFRDRGMYGSPIPSRDQNGKGYCWTHSGVSAHLLVRARDNQPYADLSAYAVACIIKGYRDEGGWGTEGVEWQAQNGCPTSAFWPQQSMSSKNDNPAMRANAKLHLVQEWMDGDSRNIRQMATALCQDIPCVTDFNWWGHSVCGCRILSWGSNGSKLRLRIWNSWSDTWKQRGMGDLSDSQAIPDNLVFPRVVYASAA